MVIACSDLLSEGFVLFLTVPTHQAISTHLMRSCRLLFLQANR